MLSITKSAVTKLIQISKTHKVNQLLFHVSGGGCNGLKYNIEPFNESPKKIDEIVPITESLNIIVDSKSIFYVIGTEIDWKEDIMGSRFDFNNPNSTSQCGCGTTFSVDMNFN